MIIDNPDFKRESLVLVKGNYGPDRIGTVVKAIKGRDSIRVRFGRYEPMTVPINKLRKVSLEDDPELFI